MTTVTVESPRPGEVPPPPGRANGDHPALSALNGMFIAEPVDKHVRLRPTVGIPVAPVVDRQTDRTPAATAKAVAPLVVVNALAVYGQLAYAYEHIAPTAWATAFRVVLSVGFAAAVESVALYVGWHAHDSLLLKAYATARRQRRYSFAIAAAVGAMNYAHFAAAGMRPTAAACAFGLLSLLSPWMWGLHTRRQQHIQLLKERKVDETGAEFSPERRRCFPIRTWQARRWSIDHNVSDPAVAWEGYNAERQSRLAAKAASGQSTNHLSPPTDSAPDRRGDRATAPRRPTGKRRRPAATGRGRQPRQAAPTVAPDPKPTAVDRQSHSTAAVANAAVLRAKYPTGLTDSDYAMRQATGWSHDRLAKAKAAYADSADLNGDPQ